jgi:hypothetical protein
MEDTLLETAASEFVESYGANALPVLRERAEIAAERGHELSARIWTDIADAAERIIDDR